jgi:hypothetical protein
MAWPGSGSARWGSAAPGPSCQVEAEDLSSQGVARHGMACRSWVWRGRSAGHGLGDAVLGAARPVGAVRGRSCLGTARRARQGEASARPRQARHGCARRGMEWQGVGWAKHGRAGLRLARRGRARIGSGGGYVAGLIAAMQGSSGQGGASPVMAWKQGTAMLCVAAPGVSGQGSARIEDLRTGRGLVRQCVVRRGSSRRVTAWPRKATQCKAGLGETGRVEAGRCLAGLGKVTRKVTQHKGLTRRRPTC